MWQITTKHFKVIHWHFVIQIQIQILYWYEIQQRIVISNNTISLVLVTPRIFLFDIGVR